MSKAIYAVAGLLALVLIGAGLYSYLLRAHVNSDTVSNTASADGTAPDAPPEPPPISPAEAIDQAKQSNAASLSPEATQAAQKVAAAKFTKVYTNSSLGFSFGHPDSLQVGGTDDTSGNTTIIAQDAATHVGFQVYVSPWAGSPVITPQQVQQDLPNVQMRSPVAVKINGIPALAFLASDANFGDSRQVWFVRNGYLYQVSGYSSQDALLEKILSTWKWIK